MLSRAIWIVFASVIFFLACRYLIYKRPITAEEARKVLLLLIFLVLGGVAIFEFLNSSGTV